MNREVLQEHHELYALIQNDTRRTLLTFIYQEPRNYTQLIDKTGLKPGSLYHHLNVMGKLVEKLDHGIYGLTPAGKRVAESLDLVEQTRPEITTQVSSQTEDSQTPETPHEEAIAETVTVLANNEYLQRVLWLGTPNYLIVGTITILTIFLAFQGIALAGVALYSAPAPLLFDIFAFLLGTASLYVVEVLTKKEVYNREIFVIVIRILGMLPATLVGITLFLLFLLGLYPSTEMVTVIFAISSTSGYIIMTSGLRYLRGYNANQAVIIALIPTAIDMLIGITILLIA